MKQNDILKRRIPFVAGYNNLGEQYIVSAKVHMDESTPHMHIVFIPVIHKLEKKSGKKVDKIACSEFWKGKDSYKKLQDEFYEYMIKNEFDLERGKKTGVEHITTEKLKQITEYDRIKEEIEFQPIEEIETQNIALVVRQNIQLVEYNKKLKRYLTKTLKLIETISEMRLENNRLREENNIIKNKNKRLNKKIQKIIKTFTEFFKIPKYMINDLFKDLKYK